MTYDYSSLFDDLPKYVYHYIEGDDPDDARHRIARRASLFWETITYELGATRTTKLSLPEDDDPCDDAGSSSAEWRKFGPGFRQSKVYLSAFCIHFVS